MKSVIKLLSWDTEKFGYPVGRIAWEEGFELKELNPELKDYQLVYMFADKPIEKLSPEIKLVDVKVVWSKEIILLEYSMSNMNQSEVSILSFQGEVNNHLLELAFQSGEYSRFFTDKRLANQEFEKLYRIWISQAAESGHVFLAKLQEKTIGFISYRIIEKRLEVELIAVNQDFHGKGIGKALVDQVEQLAKQKSLNEVRIPTQKENTKAMGFYHSLGYKIVTEQYIYHYWKK